MEILEIWKKLPDDKRVASARYFYEDKALKEYHGAADTFLARLKNFRPQFVKKLPLEKRASYLAHAPLSAELASQLLVSYHFAAQRPLMKAFLDALGIANDNGLISEDADPTKPEQTKLDAAVAVVRRDFPTEDVELYFSVLQAQAPDVWSGLSTTYQVPGTKL